MPAPRATDSTRLGGGRGVTHRDVAGVRAAAVARARWRLLSACLPPALCTTPASAQVGAVSASRVAQMCPQKMYPRAPLSRRHYLKVAKKSDGGVFFKLHAFPPRTWGGCAAREGGGWRGGSARAARRVAHLGGSARAARRGWWWGRHLSRHAGHCAFSSRGRRHGGVGRQRGTSVDIAVVCN